MSKLTYYLVYIWFWLNSLLPFPLLYRVSDIFYFFLYHVAGYRKKVVRENLRNAFPEKTPEELKKIEKRYYHYLADYMMESMKMMKISKEELLKRMRFSGKELYLGLIEKHGGVVVAMPHYGNFEWTLAMKILMKPEDVAVQVYKPLRNKYMDVMFQNIRSRFGGYNVPKHSAVRETVRLKRNGKKMVLALIADQAPSWSDVAYWTDFLNQDTDFMNGSERFAKLLNFPLMYCDIKKDRRGYCEATFELMSDKPKETADGELTEMFVRRVEQTILRDPAYWLWSHKRWKHKRENAAKN